MSHWRRRLYLYLRRRRQPRAQIERKPGRQWHALLVHDAGGGGRNRSGRRHQERIHFLCGERAARRDGATGTGGVFYYFSDHLKTASVITDAAGVITAESDYYPWGGELQ